MQIVLLSIKKRGFLQRPLKSSMESKSLFAHASSSLDLIKSRSSKISLYERSGTETDCALRYSRYW